MMKKSAIVTGSTKGIGKAIAVQLLKAGYFVYLNYAHDDSSAAAVRSELESAGFTDQFSIIKANLSDLQQTEAFFSALDLENHELHSVILNASTNGKTRHKFGEITYEEMKEVFDINLFSPFFLLQKLSPYICDNGRVVFISSAMGVYPHSTYIPYGLSKSTEIFLTKMLVKEFSDRRITVNAVAPHCIETEMFPGNRSPEHLESMKSKLAVNRFGQADEIASVVLGLIDNGYINGEVISVDGGYNFK